MMETVLKPIFKSILFISCAIQSNNQIPCQIQQPAQMGNNRERRKSNANRSGEMLFPLCMCVRYKIVCNCSQWNTMIGTALIDYIKKRVGEGEGERESLSAVSKCEKYSLFDWIVHTVASMLRQMKDTNVMKSTATNENENCKWRLREEMLSTFDNYIGHKDVNLVMNDGNGLCHSNILLCHSTR